MAKKKRTKRQDEDPFGGFGDSYAPFITSAEKKKLALSGDEFTIDSIERRDINSQDRWIATISDHGQKLAITFTPSNSRDHAMESISAAIQKRGPLDAKLGVAGRNTTKRSASYIFVHPDKWQKPKELPKQSGGR